MTAAAMWTPRPRSAFRGKWTRPVRHVIRHLQRPIRDYESMSDFRNMLRRCLSDLSSIFKTDGGRRSNKLIGKRRLAGAVNLGMEMTDAQLATAGAVDAKQDQQGGQRLARGCGAFATQRRPKAHAAFRRAGHGQRQSHRCAQSLDEGGRLRAMPTSFGT